MESKSGRFSAPPLSHAAAARLDQALGRYAIGYGETNAEAVRAIQVALVDAGQRLSDPRINIPAGCTGKYLDQTIGAVRAFQRRFGLNPDGLVGPQTLIKLDELLPPRLPSAPTAQMILQACLLCVQELDRRKPPDPETRQFAAAMHRTFEQQIIPVAGPEIAVPGAIPLLIFGLLCYMAMQYYANPAFRRQIERALQAGTATWEDATITLEQRVESLREIAEEMILGGAMSLRRQCEQKHPEKMAECLKKHGDLLRGIFNTLRENLKRLFATYMRQGGASAAAEAFRALQAIPDIFDRLKESLCAYLGCMGCTPEQQQLKCPGAATTSFVPLNRIRRFG